MGNSAEVHRHELSKVVSSRNPKDLGALWEAMRVQQIIDRQNGSRTVVEVEMLEGKVLWDWDRGQIARELGMEIRFKRFDAGDPVGYLCVNTPHVRQLNQSQKALLVVSMRRWAVRGRPKNPHTP